MLSAIVFAFSSLLISATLVPLIPSGRWWVRIWDFPRLQLFFLLALALAAQLALKPEHPAALALAAVTGLCLLWQLRCIFPYTRLRARQVKPVRRDASADQRVKLLIANVCQQNRASHGLCRVIASFDPDVLLVVEADQWWNRRLASHQHRYPHHVLVPQDNTYGMLLFSRLEIVQADILERVTKGVPSIKAIIRLRCGDLIELHCLHPEPPNIGTDTGGRDAELLLVARDSVASPYPVIVCGDINDVAWSRTTRLFQRMSGLLDPRIGRGLYATFDARRWYARWPLDHIFHDRRFLLSRLQLGSDIGSDHFPIFAELVYQPEAKDRHEAPAAADETDRQEAEEKIREAAAGRVPQETEQEPAGSRATALGQTAV